MHIQAGDILIACHFFTDEEIELDIDPRQVNNQEDLNYLIKFMIDIGKVLNKKVILTPENRYTSVAISFAPKLHEIYFDENIDPEYG